MIRLSVNINKIATLRNARGGNIPDLLLAARDCERFGAQGITVHPRPDERHIRFQDVVDLKSILQTEFNIEGFPSQNWMRLVKEIKPAQATLVPDDPGVLTSNRGWDTVRQSTLLKSCISELKDEGIRVSVFVNPQADQIEGAKHCGADRIELFTGPYAEAYEADREKAIEPYRKAAAHAAQAGLGINAGHDLNLKNLHYFARNIPGLLEVSIGHALICDALWYGLENTVQLYRRQLVTNG